MAKKRKKKMGWKGNLLLIAGAACFIMFRAVSIVLVVGMVPTLVCAIIDRSQGYVKTWTVGVMNFAGCVPFMLEIWKKGGSFEMAFAYIIQPYTLMVMYFAAGMGYVIDWAVKGMVSALMVQQAKSRLKAIQEHQKELIDRWGPEVTGTIPLDEFGFPKEITGSKPD
jgi:hypothetical protein